MKLAVMQPYFLPYIGYYQLISSVDVFVVYDNIKYTKKGWINRNRFLQNGVSSTFSLPMKHDSDLLNVVDRELAADFNHLRLLNQLKGAYAKAPYFAQTFPLLERIVCHEDRNLFRFIHNSIVEVCTHLRLTTVIRISSSVAIDHDLKGQEKVLSMCNALGAKVYINSEGGIELYSKDDFRARGIELRFVKSKPFEYAQYGNDFVPWLSIIDVLMFNPLETVRGSISHNFELI